MIRESVWDADADNLLSEFYRPELFPSMSQFVSSPETDIRTGQLESVRIFLCDINIIDVVRIQIYRYEVTRWETFLDVEEYKGGEFE